MDLLMALKALGGIVGFAIAIVVGSFISAIWLRLAAQWLQFGNVPYLTAFKSALISNFVVFALNFSMGFNFEFMRGALSPASSQRNSLSVDFRFAYSPEYVLHATIFGLLITAAIFCRTLPNKDTDSRLAFRDSLVLASFYYALAFTIALILSLLIYCIVAGLLFYVRG